VAWSVCVCVCVWGGDLQLTLSQLALILTLHRPLEELFNIL